MNGQFLVLTYTNHQHVEMRAVEQPFGSNFGEVMAAAVGLLGVTAREGDGSGICRGS